ncbi:NACHT domain-containing protein [Pseudonocardia acaciae]|uniref:NACHT domain-containing protein n=1 Tax=Pseudonocardia acaciae TaxID=551276 RepID=UPI0006849A76|nr:NACHT domain-containing protein [Pseudonocardia acaciae]
MRRPAIAPSAAVVLVTVLLPVVINLATGTVPDEWRPWLWLAWPAAGVLGVVAVVLETRRQRSRPDPAPADSTEPADDGARLDLAAAALATAVREQWTEEAAHRGLRVRDPMRVRWSAVTGRFAAEPSAVLGTAPAVGRPLRLRASGDVLDAIAGFRRLPRRQLMVLGEAGSGKSVLAILLTLGLLEHRTADEPVPVLLTLSSWHPRVEHLYTWLARNLVAEYAFLGDARRYGRDAALRLLTSGRVMPVLDGLDEMSAELRPAAIGEVDRVVQDRPVVVTCRWQEYRTAADALGQKMSFMAVQLDPVRVDDAERYLARTSTSAAKWRAVLAELRADPELPLARALSSPLLLGLARDVYAPAGSDPAELLDRDRFPDQRAIERSLLDTLIPVSYAEHPRLPGGRPGARYGEDSARRWLAFLAGHLHRLGSYDLAWWRLHRALPPRGLEVLAGLACAVLTGPSIGLLAGLVFGPRYLLVAGLATGLGIGPGAALLVGLRHGPAPSRILFSLRGRGGQVRRALAVGLAAGPVAGTIFGLLFWLVGRVQPGLEIGMVAGLVAGTVGGLGVGVMSALRAPIESARVVDPASLLAADRGAALVQAGAGGLAAALVAGTLAALAAGPHTRPGLPLVAGLGVGVGVALVATCTTAWGQWVLTRLWLALGGRTPWRLLGFLRDAHRRNVLRQTGGVHQFRHALLQAHLAGAVPDV